MYLQYLFFVISGVSPLQAESQIEIEGEGVGQWHTGLDIHITRRKDQGSGPPVPICRDEAFEG